MASLIDPAAPPSEVRDDAPPVPEKFRDPATGGLRADALLRSYLELERRLSQPQARPFWETGDAPDDATRAAVLRALGVPDAPDGYAVACDHGLFEPDPDIDARLHAAGFTRQQAQLLYDLAAERMVPMIQEVATRFQAERELERLHAEFGGPAGWRAVSRQILAWAKASLPPAAVEALSTTYDGVMAMRRMMEAGEPAGVGGGAPAAAADGDAEVRRMMRDPRYWRDREPGVVARVTSAFERMYPG
jgi:hypothetical protein